MAELANFSSVLEVSAGLHLAYGLLREVYDRPIVSLEKQIDRLKSEFAELKSAVEVDPLDRSSMSTSIWLVEIGSLLKIAPHSETNRRFTTISIGVACVSILLLVYSGFKPSAGLNPIGMGALIGCLLLPMPCMVLTTKLVMRNDIKEIGVLLWQANREMCALREKYKPGA